MLKSPKYSCNILLGLEKVNPAHSGVIIYKDNVIFALFK
jgi:hypothetical protein